MTINAFLSAKTCLFRSYPCNTGPSDGSFMLGCDNCDRWYHGSCMKIDKETGDALSKWICPPCTRGLLFPHQEAATTNVNEEEPKTLTTEEVVWNRCFYTYSSAADLQNGRKNMRRCQVWVWEEGVSDI